MLLIKNTVLTILLLCSLTACCQSDEERANANTYSTKVLSIPTASEKIDVNIPLTSIQVFDARFDTSCLGISSRESGVKLRVMKSKNPLVEEIKNYYTSAISLTSDGAQTELYCFIKKLILSNYILETVIDEPNRSSRGHNADLWSGILFSADFYVLHDGAYIPFCRFDTTIMGIKDIEVRGENYLSDALTASLKKISRTSADKINKGRKLTRAEIDEFNLQRFDVDILQHPPAKGIYYTFNDFLRNKPAAGDFTVERDRKGDFLYVKNEKGEARLVTDLWGYSDGKDIYIYSANNYFKLQRTGNGFKIYGAKEYTGQRNLRGNFGLIDMVSPNSNYSKGQTATKYYLVKDFFILDMETGKLF